MQKPTPCISGLAIDYTQQKLCTQSVLLFVTAPGLRGSPENTSLTFQELITQVHWKIKEIRGANTSTVTSGEGDKRSAHSRAGAHTTEPGCRLPLSLERSYGPQHSRETAELAGAVHPQAFSEHGYNSNWWDFWKMFYHFIYLGLIWFHQRS